MNTIPAYAAYMEMAATPRTTVSGALINSIVKYPISTAFPRHVYTPLTTFDFRRLLLFGERGYHQLREVLQQLQGQECYLDLVRLHLPSKGEYTDLYQRERGCNGDAIFCSSRTK